jgi:uncharacterized protein (TIGR03000 family)
MSGQRHFALRIASLTTALLVLSVSAPAAHAGGGPGGGRGGYGGGRGDYGGYRGGYDGYRGGYYRGGRYGYYPGFGIGIGFYSDPYLYDYAPTYVYGASPVIVASPATVVPSIASAPPDAAPSETTESPPPAPTDDRARLQILVPADAEVWFNGSPTTQRGGQRVFESPVLTPGHDYQYEIRAKWADNGRVVDRTRTVIVHANALVGLDFSRAELIGAPVPVPVPPPAK